MEDMTKSMDESLQSILDDKATYLNFESITHNVEYTELYNPVMENGTGLLSSS